MTDGSDDTDTIEDRLDALEDRMAELNIDDIDARIAAIENEQ